VSKVIALANQKGGTGKTTRVYKIVCAFAKTILSNSIIKWKDGNAHGINGQEAVKGIHQR
jgi:septum formation inhibitor-activating ATPase MinD